MERGDPWLHIGSKCKGIGYLVKEIMRWFQQPPFEGRVKEKAQEDEVW